MLGTQDIWGIILGAAAYAFQRAVYVVLRERICVALLSENTLIASISAYLIVEVQHVLATLFQADFERKCGLGL